MAEILTWEDERILRMMGVLLAVLGAILVSPHGFKRLVYVTKLWVIGIYRAIRGRGVNIHVPVATASTGTLTTRLVAGTSIPADAPLGEQVRLLQLALGQLQVTVQNDYDNLNGKISELRALFGSVDERVEKLLARIREEQEQTASLDAAGFPVIAWGIILSGVPQELAAIPVVGWFFIVIGLILGFTMFRKTVRDGAWGKKGSDA